MKGLMDWQSRTSMLHGEYASYTKRWSINGHMVRLEGLRKLPLTWCSPSTHPSRRADIFSAFLIRWR